MTATDQGEAVLAHAVAAYAEALGSRLVAGYAPAAGRGDLAGRFRRWRARLLA